MIFCFSICMREILGGVNEGGIPRKWGYMGVLQCVVVCCSVLQHMGLEHASREKKFTMVNFLIFVQKNVSRIRFQEIKICP